MTRRDSWPALLSTLLRPADLDRSETAWAMDQIMRGEATSAQIAGFLVALRAKGETVEEIQGLVEAMYRHARTIEVRERPAAPGRLAGLLDIVGTGGDGANTVNISTMAAIVAAGAGATVVKHGNRAASSTSGAADVLEKLGVRLDLKPAQVGQVAERTGITFCFAPVFHPAYRYAIPTRRELGVPTAFNFLGPLTNPAGVRTHAVGVADPRMAPLVAGVLARRGSRALVFRGDDGLDELTLSTTSRVWVVREGTVTESVLDPTALGLERVGLEALRGRDAAYNARVAQVVLAGDRDNRPVREAVLLNTAAALAALDLRDPAEVPLVEQVRAGLDRAVAAVDSGAAATALADWVRVTQELAPRR